MSIFAMMYLVWLVIVAVSVGGVLASLIYNKVRHNNALPLSPQEQWYDHAAVVPTETEEGRAAAMADYILWDEAEIEPGIELGYSKRV